MQEPREHHYLPKFYLKGFISPLRSRVEEKPILWVYERGTSPFKSVPKNETCQRDFYAYTEGGERNQVVEKQLGKLESIAAPLVRKTLDPQYFFSTEEKREMAGFVALMFNRVPSAREFVETTVSEFMKEWMQNEARDARQFSSEFKKFQKETGSGDISADELRAFILDGEYEIEQTSEAFNLRTMMEATADLMPVLFSLGWQIWHADSDQLFITSDSPVVTALPGKKSMRFGMGFGLPGVEIVFPLTRTSALFMKQGIREGSYIAIPREIKDMNKRLMVCAKRFLYAPIGSEKIEKLFEKLGGTIEYGKNAFLPQKPVEFSKEDFKD